MGDFLKSFPSVGHRFSSRRDFIDHLRAIARCQEIPFKIDSAGRGETHDWWTYIDENGRRPAPDGQSEGKRRQYGCKWEIRFKKCAESKGGEYIVTKAILEHDAACIKARRGKILNPSAPVSTPAVSNSSTKGQADLARSRSSTSLKSIAQSQSTKERVSFAQNGEIFDSIEVCHDTIRPIAEALGFRLHKDSTRGKFRCWRKKGSAGFTKRSCPFQFSLIPQPDGRVKVEDVPTDLVNSHNHPLEPGLDERTSPLRPPLRRIRSTGSSGGPNSTILQNPSDILLDSSEDEKSDFQFSSSDEEEENNGEESEESESEVALVSAPPQARQLVRTTTSNPKNSAKQNEPEATTSKVTLASSTSKRKRSLPSSASGPSKRLKPTSSSPPVVAPYLDLGRRESMLAEAGVSRNDPVAFLRQFTEKQAKDCLGKAGLNIFETEALVDWVSTHHSK